MINIYRIREREICNGASSYFTPSLERGHRIFWRLALWDHSLFQCMILTESKIILKYGLWTISALFHIGNTRPEQIYTTRLTFQRVEENFWPGHTLFNFTSSTTHFLVFYFYKYCAVLLQPIICRVAGRVVYKNCV